MPFFSVIIPSYNRSEFLPSTIQSILSQDFQDFEILVIDDGSTDNTRDVMVPFCAQNERITYFHKANEERAAARNFGIKHAKGDFIIFLDSDDEFLPGHLSHLKQLIGENPKINFFATKFDFIENGQVFKAPIDRLNAGIFDYRILKRGNPFACNVCIRKNNVDLRLFKEDRSFSGMEDWIFLFANTWSQDLLLSAETTVRMNEHPNRSMRFNKIIVEKRLLATQYLLKNFAFQRSEKRKIFGYTSYFCAIHSYLDNNRSAAMKWIFRAMGDLGVKSDLTSLLLKLMFGKRIVGKIKEVISHK
jgi:glycosyltransferase involved in cell wall biosynthesis